jgi:hypothetical protein
VSKIRAEFCGAYFIRQHGISPARITSETYGSDRSPEMATNDWRSHRCVELIMIRE